MGPIDFVISGANIEGRPDPVDIALSGGRIAAMEPEITADAPRHDAAGCLAFGGFAETHIHLDKALILDRCPLCEGTLDEAIRLTAEAKSAFTEDDVHARASKVVEAAILHGTNRMRSFVEIDPRAGFRSFRALKRIRDDYAFAIDLELCAFAQEGITNEPETATMLTEALGEGADSIGGCPYTDPDPEAHVSKIFDLAERFDVAADFHVDFDLDPDGSILPEIINQTLLRGWSGRVSVGHATKLSAMAPADVHALAERLANAGIAVTVLPATDLFLTGRDADRMVPRGVAPAMELARAGVVASVASNNILNPFTPYGDASLARMANMFANVAQLSTDGDMEKVFDMVSRDAARLLDRPHDMTVGGLADIVLIDAPDAASAVRSIAPVIAGWKNGRQSFRRDRAELLRP